mgnify:CR=1 FL=1
MGFFLFVGSSLIINLLLLFDSLFLFDWLERKLPPRMYGVASAIPLSLAENMPIEQDIF